MPSLSRAINLMFFILISFCFMSTGCHSAKYEEGDGSAQDVSLDGSEHEGGDSDADSDADGDSDADHDAYVEDGGVDGWVDPCQDASPPDCVRYVDISAPDGGDGLSWKAAFKSIQEAIDSAYQEIQPDGGPSECEVWVAKGTYRIFKSAPEDTLQLKPHVALYGGFAGTEDLRCERRAKANAAIITGCEDDRNCILTSDPGTRTYHVITGSSDTAIDGFIVTGGDTHYDDMHNEGAGLLQIGGTVSLTNMTFKYHTDSAVACYNCHMNIKASDVSINMGGIYFIGGYGSIDNCMISGNISLHGSGIYAENTELIITNTVFQHNGVSEYGGAIYFIGESMSIINCIFYDNACNENGGALSVIGDPIEIINSVFVENEVMQTGAYIRGRGGAIYRGGGYVYNSLFWGNSPDDYELEMGDYNYQFWNSLIRETSPTHGNFEKDPLFVDQENGDLHLQAGSSCIDKADDTKAPATDIEGHGRLDIPGVGTPGTKADVGAYEYRPKW